MTDASLIQTHVARALERHRGIEPLVRAVAAELPASERGPWLKMADALATGDVAQGTAAATASMACWIPLFASAEDDPRLTVRLLQIAARPPVVTANMWWLLGYPLAVLVVAYGVLAMLAVVVLPAFESLYAEDMIWMRPLPLPTRIVLGLRPIITSVWPPIVVVALLAPLRWWWGVRFARSAAAVASFTRSLARLVAAEIPTAEALRLAGHSAGATQLDLATPRPPLTYAAAAALDFAPRSAAVLLDAIADCHADRSRGRRDAATWFIGPVLVVLVGLVVWFLLVALFMPLFGFPQDLS